MFLLVVFIVLLDFTRISPSETRDPQGGFLGARPVLLDPASSHRHRLLCPAWKRRPQVTRDPRDSANDNFTGRTESSRGLCSMRPRPCVPPRSQPGHWCLPVHMEQPQPPGFWGPGGPRAAGSSGKGWKQKRERGDTSAPPWSALRFGQRELAPRPPWPPNPAF